MSPILNQITPFKLIGLGPWAPKIFRHAWWLQRTPPWPLTAAYQDILDQNRHMIDDVELALVKLQVIYTMLSAWPQSRNTATTSIQKPPSPSYCVARNTFRTLPNSCSTPIRILLMLRLNRLW